MALLKNSRLKPKKWIITFVYKYGGRKFRSKTTRKSHFHLKLTLKYQPLAVYFRVYPKLHDWLFRNWGWRPRNQK